MTLVWTILSIVAIIVAVIALAPMVLPRKAQLTRDIWIKAPVGDVFVMVSGFSRFNEWSPWAKIDPEGTQYDYTGPEQGVGARMSWTSDNNKVGKGAQEVMDVTKPNYVELSLEFAGFDPAKAYFEITEKDGGAHVVWGFEQDFTNQYFPRFFTLMIGKFLGPSYEEGLTDLKAVMEAGSPPQETAG